MARRKLTYEEEFAREERRLKRRKWYFLGVLLFVLALVGYGVWTVYVELAEPVTYVDTEGNVLTEEEVAELK